MTWSIARSLCDSWASCLRWCTDNAAVLLCASVGRLVENGWHMTLLWQQVFPENKIVRISRISDLLFVSSAWSQCLCICICIRSVFSQKCFVLRSRTTICDMPTRLDWRLSVSDQKRRGSCQSSAASGPNSSGKVQPDSRPSQGRLTVIVSSLSGVSCRHAHWRIHSSKTFLLSFGCI